MRRAGRFITDVDGAVPEIICQDLIRGQRAFHQQLLAVALCSNSQSMLY
jgi:hypothetical protein